MKAEQISDALNLLDDDIINETAKIRKKTEKRSNARNRHQAKGNHRRSAANWKILGTIAACLCLLLIGKIFVDHFLESPIDRPEDTETEAGEASTGGTLNETNTDETISGATMSDTPATLPDLPMLTLDIEHFGGEGSGYEGIMHNNISEYIKYNPWNPETTPELMPVFQNSKISETFVGFGWSQADMYERLDFVAAAFDAEVLTSEYTEATQYMSASVSAELSGNISVDIAAKGSIRISLKDSAFGNAPQDSKNYNFSSDATEGEALSAFEYLLEQFAGLITFAQPEKIMFGHYNIYGEYGRDYYLYDGGGDVVEDILNYNYSRIRFGVDESGNTSVIWLINNLACAEKIGDYPIISPDAARELLISGNYVTSVPYDFPGEEYIAAVELKYRSSSKNETLIPYYRFWVELPERNPEQHLTDMGIKDFGAYYVPAVDARYIENMPVYDGSFN